jgi:hypothetical protein
VIFLCRCSTAMLRYDAAAMLTPRYSRRQRKRVMRELRFSARCRVLAQRAARQAALRTRVDCRHAAAMTPMPCRRMRRMLQPVRAAARQR